LGALTVERFALSLLAHPTLGPRELLRVRRWIRRARVETALGWGQAGFLRRLSVSRGRWQRPRDGHL